MESQEYQGWTNRETWATNLWIENTQGLSQIVADYAKQEIEGHDEGEEINSYYLGEVIRNFIEDEILAFHNVKASEEAFNMLTDIGSLYRVNWRELADYYLSVMRENLAFVELMSAE
jgi:hypothetical protein